MFEKRRNKGMSYSYTVPVGGLMHKGLWLPAMGSNVGSSSRMSWLRLLREISRSESPWLPFGSVRLACRWTVSCGPESRRIVWPTLRTWLGIIWDMPRAVGIMLGELSLLGPLLKQIQCRAIGYTVLTGRICPRFCFLQNPPFKATASATSYCKLWLRWIRLTIPDVGTKYKLKQQLVVLPYVELLKISKWCG